MREHRTWDAKNPVAPFDSETGNLLHYPEVWWGHTLEWREVRPFEATLQLEDYGRGRSAAYFHWKDEQGHGYPMFLKDFVETLLALDSKRGQVKGTWRVVKRGQNYGLALHASG